jgi:hypothetical protein
VSSVEPWKMKQRNETEPYPSFLPLLLRFVEVQIPFLALRSPFLSQSVTGALTPA